ncbi:factor H binding protein domain-containing protein [Ursidibacter sp. B-7004-1]
MSIKRISIATAILLSLTACGSSGGGSNNAKPKTDTQVHTQPQIKQTEIEQLKQQLANAQQAAQQAEEKLKNLSLLSNKEKANLQKELTATKNNLEAITTQLKQANSASTKTVDEIKKTLATTQNNLTNLTQELAKANEVLVQKEKAIQAEQEAKLKAEAALLALNTPLTKEQIYKLAISAGLGNGWADELATDLVGKTKQEVTDEIILASKISKVRTLARNFGYSAQDARAFEKANRDKSYDDLADLLQKEAEDKQNAREALITELKQLAQSKGLQEWEANNFAYSNVAQGKAVALAELDKLVERNNFIKELTQLAKDKGLEDWEAGNFANNYANGSKESALAELDKLLLQKEENVLKEAKRVFWSPIDVSEAPLGFTSQYGKKESSVYGWKGEDTGKKNITYVDVYNQKYSIVLGRYDNDHYSDPVKESYEVDIINLGGGLRTTDEQLPTEGTATYKGVAFSKDDQGNLEYTIDFTNRQGNGSITGLSVGELVLEKGELYKAYDREWKTAGNVTATDWKDQKVAGKYDTLLFGPNAEEITGQVKLTQDRVYDHSTGMMRANADKALLPPFDSSDNNGYSVGFGGTRGEIQK